MPIPRDAPLTNATRASGNCRICLSWASRAVKRLRRLEQLDPNAVRVDHVDRLAAAVGADVRALDLGHEPYTVCDEPPDEPVDVVHVEAKVPGSRVRGCRIHGLPRDVLVFEDFEEGVRRRQSED